MTRTDLEAKARRCDAYLRENGQAELADLFCGLLALIDEAEDLVGQMKDDATMQGDDGDCPTCGMKLVDGVCPIDA
jgi:hypothetical protein